MISVCSRHFESEQASGMSGKRARVNEYSTSRYRCVWCVDECDGLRGVGIACPVRLKAGSGVYLCAVDSVRRFWFVLYAIELVC